jgi:hypothetical protein
LIAEANKTKFGERGYFIAPSKFGKSFVCELSGMHCLWSLSRHEMRLPSEALTPTAAMFSWVVPLGHALLAIFTPLLT